MDICCNTVMLLLHGCRSLHNCPSELDRLDDELNVEYEDEEEDDEDDKEDDDDDDDDASSSMLPSDCYSFNDKRELWSVSDEVTIMVCRALFSSI